MSEKATDPAVLAADLQTVVGAVVRSMRAASPGRDLTLAQISVLKRLDREGPRTVADLARADKITHQSAAATVATLVDRGLIRRATDPTDLRRRLLHLTDPGHTVLSERRDAGYDYLADLIDQRLSEADRAHLAHSLTLIRRLLP